MIPDKWVSFCKVLAVLIKGSYEAYIDSSGGLGLHFVVQSPVCTIDGGRAGYCLGLQASKGLGFMVGVWGHFQRLMEPGRRLSGEKRQPVKRLPVDCYLSTL